MPLGKTGTLKAFTTGRLFPEGGKIVEFFADGKQIGRTLSGGDGYAFIRHSPSARGVKMIRISAGASSDEGTLLVTGKKDKVILIEIESILFTRPFSFEPSKEGKEALKQLSKQFMIIYLSGIMDMKRSRLWLKEKEFPLFPVFPPGNADITANLEEEGIPVYAIIASPDTLSRTQHAEKKFSFEGSEEDTVVKDWKELLKKLN
ncbi:MAG: hypothetical protein C4538_00445 [Nitrospiraceae bacterium]|nr:MAG: hypothetical protein C4538_00445 [Nitrospiraceae bacterium]